MEKTPDKFELIFYDENNNEITRDDYKVEPLKLLIIRRIPSYKLAPNFVERIRDPAEISSLRFSDYVVTARKSSVTTINYIDPLEKIQQRISKELIYNNFACKLCKGIEDDPVIMLCCGETICEKCAVNKDNTCPMCNEVFKGFMPNRKIKEMKDKIFEIMNKTQQQQIQAQQANIKPDTLSVEADTTSQNFPTSKIDTDNKSKLPQLVPIQNPTQTQQTSPTPNINPFTDVNTNPHAILFDNCRFFIIKSSNKENVDISQKYSEWATTVSNQKKLNEAFQNSNVILIFSVNKSGNFQGYAIMSSFISDKVSNIWQNESSV